MKKYFLYELKKSLWPTLVLTAICALPYIATLSTMSLRYDWMPYNLPETFIPSNPCLSIVVWEGIALCFLAPVLVYSFKTSKRGVDAYYALPIKREKLYLVKTLVGLFLVLVPFTVSFFGGFVTLLCREGNLFYMGWYLPAYFGLLGYLILLFGVNAFAFTRAHKISDGVLFMIAYAFVGAVLVWYAESVTHVYFWDVSENFMTFGGAYTFGNNMTSLIRGYGADWNIWTFICPVVYGAAGYALLFYNVRFEKGEDSEQVCESWFGYRTLIPLFVAFGLGATGTSVGILSVCMAAVAGAVATVIWRRKFKFSWKYWAALGGAVAIGLLLCLVTGLTVPPDVNPPEEVFRGLFSV